MPTFYNDYNLIKDVINLLSAITGTAEANSLWQENGAIQREIDVMTVRLNRAVRYTDPTARVVDLVRDELSHSQRKGKIEAIKILRTKYGHILVEANLVNPEEYSTTTDGTIVLGLRFCKEWVEKYMEDVHL